MTFDERVAAVRALTFSERQARFLVTVALHSGYCLRRHYEAFAGIRYGKNVRALLDGLVVRGWADRFSVRADRGILYHVHGRSLYRAVGEEGCRNRRPVAPALIARKLMLLDVVIAHPDVTWLATEAEKVEQFVSGFGVPETALPQRRGPSSSVRYFGHFPIFVAGDPPIPHFVFLSADTHPDPFVAFLRAHAPLFRCLTRWVVVVVGLKNRLNALVTLQREFDRFVASLASTLPAGHGDLQWYFERRRLVDRGELAQVSVFDLRRYRELRQRFDSPAHEALYAEWTTTGRIGAATPGSPTGDSTGTFLVETLPFTYEQCGSLPGVA